MAEFNIQGKVVAVTVVNAANMGAAARSLKMVKIGCFAHSFNLTAQIKLFSNRLLTTKIPLPVLNTMYLNYIYNDA